MQFSSLDVARRDIRDLSKIFSSLSTESSIAGLLQDLSTFQELHQLAERWRIAKLIHMGFPYRVIREKTGASHATIARVAEKMQYGTGTLRHACNKRENRISASAQEDPAPTDVSFGSLALA